MPELQAARGASLSEAARGRGRPRLPALALGVAVAGLALDAATKEWALRALEPGRSEELLGPVLRLTLVRNPGAAFSTGGGFTVVISIIAIVATVVVLGLILRVRHRGWALALGLLLAGVSGNLLDRLVRAPGPLRGHVIDFLHLPRWPVFNVADICITVAGVCFVLLLVRGVRLDGTRVDDEQDRAPDDASARETP